MKRTVLMFGMGIAFIASTTSSSFASESKTYKALAQAYRHAKKPSQFLFTADKEADCAEVYKNGDMDKSSFLFSRKGAMIVATQSNGGSAEYFFTARSRNADYLAEEKIGTKKVELKARETEDGSLIIKMSGEHSGYITCSVQTY
ncbi:MAG: hypothetical protein ABIQ95_14040 [Bdellovibrionia bacterium]